MIAILFAALFAALFGVAFCFLGYRLFLVMLPIWGFFAGFWLGAEVTSLLLGAGFLATTIGWVVGFLVGLLGAILSYLFYLWGVVLIAAGFGAALGSGFMAALGFESGFVVVIVILISAIVVVALTLLLNLQKYVIIAITAIGGANILLLSGLLLFGQVSLEELQITGNTIKPILQDSWFWLVVWLALAVAGFVVQTRANRSYTFTREQYLEGWG